MPRRSTDPELARRVKAALELLSSGAGSAHSAAILASRYGVSLRTARRYVAAASFDLVEFCTPAELDRQAMLSLHRLDLVAGKCMESGTPEDLNMAIRATKAHASALAALRRAISVPAGTRFRLPTQADVPGLNDSDPLPF